MSDVCRKVSFKFEKYCSQTQQVIARYMQIYLLISSKHCELCTVKQYDRTYSLLPPEH